MDVGIFSVIIKQLLFNFLDYFKIVAASRLSFSMSLK